jgi:hypothetical protein
VPRGHGSKANATTQASQGSSGSRGRLDKRMPPERNGKTEKRCLQATLRIRPKDCVTKQSYEARDDPTSDLFAKILSQNGNGLQTPLSP